MKHHRLDTVLLNSTDAKGQKEARQILAFENDQEGFLGGRIVRLLHFWGKPTYGVRSYYLDDGEPGHLLPDGVTRVRMPKWLSTRLTARRKRA